MLLLLAVSLHVIVRDNALHCDRSFLRLLLHLRWLRLRVRHGDLPVSLVILEYESLFVEPSQDGGRAPVINRLLLVLAHLLAFQSNLLLEPGDFVLVGLLVFLLRLGFKFEGIHFGLCPPALGAHFEHVHTAAVSS